MISDSSFLPLNQPSTNVFHPTSSILPDRFNSTSSPEGRSIVGYGLNSISEPEDLSGEDCQPGAGLHE